MLPGEEWVCIDDEGNIRQKDGVSFHGEVVGKIQGEDKASTLEILVNRFKELDERCSEFEGLVRSSTDKIKYLSPIRHMIESLPEAKAIGNFDNLISRLRSIEQDILNIQDERKQKKEDLCNKAESLSESLDWKETSDQLQSLQKQWKRIGSAGQDYDEELWQRFRTAQDKFFQHREEYYDKLEQEREENRKKKEELCQKAESLINSSEWRETTEVLQELQKQWKEIGSAGRDYDEDLWLRFRIPQDIFFQRRKEYYEKLDLERDENRKKKEGLCLKAESLSGSMDWKSTTDILQGLMEQWKQVGYAGRDYEDDLWLRFKSALDAFYERRNSAYELIRQDQKENLKRKDGLCEIAESLANSKDIRSAMEKVKEIQAEWKTIGSVPKERSDELWNRFRIACDSVFDRAREEFSRRNSEWESRISEVISRKKRQIESLRESISHDKSNIQRWQNTFSGIYKDGRSGNIRSMLEDKISDVENRIQEKESKINEIEESIRDMESRLQSLQASRKSDE